MKRGRFQDQNIPTGVNELDRTNMTLRGSVIREGILHNYKPAGPLQDKTHYIISLILKMIRKILMNIPNPL